MSEPSKWARLDHVAIAHWWDGQTAACGEDFATDCRQANDDDHRCWACVSVLAERICG